MEYPPIGSVPPPLPKRPHIEPSSSSLFYPSYNQYSHISQPFPYQPYTTGQFNYIPTSNYQTPYINPSSWTENSVIGRNTEDSIKNAFQSIESIVNAFVSVANLLNSTHSAVYNSFRAVIGVVEQFHTLKQLLITNIVVSIIRWIRFLWRRLLAFLHLKPRNYANPEAIWENISRQGGSQTSHFRNATLLFWIIAVGGPFLLYKCIVRPALNQVESNNWNKGVGEHYTAQALYDFDSTNPNELPFSAFDMLRIAPKWKQPNVKDWLLASNINGSKLGLVPINYIKLLKKFNAVGEEIEERK